MIVYAKFDNMYIWSDNNSVHKAGKVPLHEPLKVVGESGAWYRIERPENISLPEDPKYTSYWVEKDNCLNRLPLPKPPVPSFLEQFIAWLKRLWAWLVQWFR